MRYDRLILLMLACAMTLFMLVAFVGCKSAQPIEQTRDSVRVEYRHDSVYVYKHDSIFRDRWRNGDTVFVVTEKWQVRWRDRLQVQHDTIATTKTETVQVKYVPAYYKRVSTGFWVLLVLLLAIIGFKAYKWWLKIQSGGIL